MSNISRFTDRESEPDGRITIFEGIIANILNSTEEEQHSGGSVIELIVSISFPLNHGRLWLEGEMSKIIVA